MAWNFKPSYIWCFAHTKFGTFYYPPPPTLPKKVKKNWQYNQIVCHIDTWCFCGRWIRSWHLFCHLKGTCSLDLTRLMSTSLKSIKFREGPNLIFYKKIMLFRGGVKLHATRSTMIIMVCNIRIFEHTTKFLNKLGATKSRMRKITSSFFNRLRYEFWLL